ncbi:MAG TPA: HAMP domain-containing sensor histidine kinase [Oscillatoriaceae cyanobacterium]
MSMPNVAGETHSPYELTLARWISFLGAVLYPLWGYFCLALIPQAHEQLWQRWAIGAFCFVVWALSFASAAVAARLPQLVYVIYALITGHYLYIVHDNAFSPMYVIGTFIAVGAINACFQRLRPFAIYSLAVLVGTLAITLATPNAHQLGLFLMLGLLTSQILMYVSLNMRLQVLSNLQAARSELAKERAELEQVNAELRQAGRYKDEFLAVVSHELRTPLNAVLGFGSALQDGVVGDMSDAQHGYLDKILSAAESQLELVSELLDLSRIQAGKFSLEVRPMAFQDEVQRVLANLAPAAERAGLALMDQVPAELPELMADPQRVDQVLSNLVSNAIKFSSPGGRVIVRARVVGEALWGEVADTGPGISKTDQLKLFKPFSQLDSSSTRRAGGAGLGLSICKALVEAHGGQIELESEPGHGCVFRFSLPLRGPASEPLEKQIPASDELPGSRSER